MIYYDERCLDYEQPGHPESPERVRAAYEELKNRFEFAAPEPASDEDLLRVHTPEHLERVRDRSFSNPDCPPYSRIDFYALLAAGGAIAAAESNGFSLMRPPGHHSGPNRVAGFCYYNSIAIAVRRLGRRTLIIDFDGHHGDGTQEIFLGDEQVTYLSLHSSPNYPGMGLRSERNCLNYPLPFGRCGEDRFLATLDEALGKVEMGAIEQVAVSAGFDTYKRDPLATIGLETETFRKIGERIAALGKPTFSVLEGGYVVDDLGANILAYLEGLGFE